MGVDLGGGNAGVAKHLLDDAQVGTIVQQMRGERVAQDVRVDALVDFLIDDYSSLSVLPIEVKSGKDYNTHASLDRFISNDDYSANNAIVFSNSGEIRVEDKITYYPVYMCMCIKKSQEDYSGIEKVENIDF